MTFITYEPVESIAGGVERDVCETDGCEQTDDLAFVTNSGRGDSGVYCRECAHAILLGGEA